MKISELISESNIYSLKTGKQVTPQTVPMRQAFGHPLANDVESLGVNFVEKPDYWEDLIKSKPIDDLTMHKVRKYLQSVGESLTVYTAKQIFGKDNPYGPTSKTTFIPEETIFVVDVPEFGKFLANKHGATSYIRNWASLVS